VYISAEDGSGFNSEALQWSDVYAKVNIDPNVRPEQHHEKILPIGPSFGVKNYGLGSTLIHIDTDHNDGLNRISQLAQTIRQILAT
jgi:hypothetical protein